MNRGKHIRYLIPTVALFGLGGYIYSNAVSSQKQHSSLFKGLLFHLRHDSKLQRLLSENNSSTDIRFEPKLMKTNSWWKFKSDDGVSGHINNMQGVAEIEFFVVGKNESGEKIAKITFKGKKHENVPDLWIPKRFEAVVKEDDGGKVLDFLQA
ncbi:hypothetical protein HK098_006212 [Nowakowskiella sp. JEL0407]|nr:hypothetical protein HK098_006212 [Nowakowskiella sp. JEL0407]